MPDYMPHWQILPTNRMQLIFIVIIAQKSFLLYDFKHTNNKEIS